MNDKLLKQIEIIAKLELDFNEAREKVIEAVDAKVKASQIEADIMNYQERLKKELDDAYGKMKEIIIKNKGVK